MKISRGFEETPEPWCGSFEDPFEVWWAVGCPRVSLMQVLWAGMFQEFLFMSWLHQSPAPVCFHRQHLDDAEEKEKPSTSTWTTQTPPSQYRKLHLRVCGRFGGAGYVWGCRGTDTFPGLVSETRQRQRHSAPRSIRCLLSTEEDNWGSVEARGANLYGSTSFCQVMGTLPVLNLA